jgi:ubiquinone/menaquinone biosynthesis C-methylase UbiE
MNDFQKKYYEQPSFWNYDYATDPIEKKRIEEIYKIIPKDVKTILDVGCGNGSFLNFLLKTNKYNGLMGVDFSQEALKYVKTEKIGGNISELPFENNSFDLVTCLEVLEHLTEEEFNKGIAEIQRVSKKYIIVTVPNEEDIQNSLVMCPKCYCWFNSYFHLRSFQKQDLEKTFDNFTLFDFKKIGPESKIYKYPPFLLSFYRSWLKPTPLATAICPQCGYKYAKKENLSNDHNHITFSRIVKNIIKSVVPKETKSQWIMALYIKK